MTHVPVLLNEAINFLQPEEGDFFIDGTLGAGGHTKAILNKIGPKGKLLAIDWDKSAAEKIDIKPKGKSLIFINDNFAKLPEILEEKKLRKADGLILDLGFSSDQIEWSGRGFSFLKDEPLLMTYSDDSEPVYKILSQIHEYDLEKILREYGEERFAGRIARSIVARQKMTNPIRSTKDLANIVSNAVPGNYEHGRIHPATRTFLALRIYANKELENLETVLKNLHQIVKKGGRVAIISFHSLEDRIVKNYFRNYYKEGRAELLTKKPVPATREEIFKNPRSRSAKIRAIKIK